jgi:hypothetical protein
LRSSGQWLAGAEQNRKLLVMLCIFAHEGLSAKQKLQQAFQDNS